MILIPCIVGGVLALGIVLAFIVSLRGQSLADRHIDKLVALHAQLLEHLAVAANPDAWLAQQAEQARKERREEEKESAASDKTPDPEGIF